MLHMYQQFPYVVAGALSRFLRAADELWHLLAPDICYETR